MKLNSNLTIKSTHLILKLIDEKYIDEINKNFTQEVAEYMPFNPNGNRNEIITFVEEAKKNLIEKTDIVFVVLDLDEKFIGCCGMHNINPESVEVGLWLKKERQDQGLGTEVIINLINFIEQNLKIDYIIYPVDRENIRSLKIPQKLGFTAFKTYTKQKSDSINLNIIEYRKFYFNRAD